MGYIRTGNGSGNGALVTGSGGTIVGWGAATQGPTSVVTLGALAPSCLDTFTGLPLPYTLSSPWTGGAFTVLTPATTLLQFAGGGGGAATSAAAQATATTSAVVLSAYGMFGVNASGATSGTPAALRQASAESRLTGLRMLFADASLSSFVVIAAAGLAALPTGTIPACATPEARTAAVLATVASRISSPGTFLDLSGSSSSSSGFGGGGATTILSAAVAAAAAGACKAAPATLAEPAVATLLSQAGLLYATAVGSLGVNSSVLAEMTALPAEALSLAARVSYLVQAAGPAALAAAAAVGGGNSAAVSQLVADWRAQLSAAPVNLNAVTAALGMEAMPAPSDRRISVRGAGGLASCKVTARDVYLWRGPMDLVTDAAGTAAFQSGLGVMVRAPSGCNDSVLSSDGQIVSSKIPLQVLLPFGQEPAVADVAASLATAAFLTAAAASTAPPRHIAAADYAAVYNYFGVGLPGAADALPAGADFVRQNWQVPSALAARAFLVNARLLSALVPAAGFLSGLLRGTQTVDQISDGLMAQMARDVVGGTLRLDSSAYLRSTLWTCYNATRGSVSAAAAGRRRQQQMSALDDKQLDSLLSAIANIAVQSNAMLTQIDSQVVLAAATAAAMSSSAGQAGAAAAAAAAAADANAAAAAAVRSGAQVAAVVHSGLATAVAQLAAAAAAGDTATASGLLSTLLSNFTGAALLSRVTGASVDVSPLSWSPTLATSTVTTRDAGGGSTSGGGGGSSNAATVAAITVGGAAGMLLLVLAGLLLRVRRTRDSFRFDSSIDTVVIVPSSASQVALEDADAAAYGTATGSGGGAVTPEAGVVGATAAVAAGGGEGTAPPMAASAEVVALMNTSDPQQQQPSSPLSWYAEQVVRLHTQLQMQRQQLAHQQKLLASLQKHFGPLPPPLPLAAPPRAAQPQPPLQSVLEPLQQQPSLWRGRRSFPQAQPRSEVRTRSANTRDARVRSWLRDAAAAAVAAAEEAAAATATAAATAATGATTVTTDASRGGVSAEAGGEACGGGTVHSPGLDAGHSIPAPKDHHGTRYPATGDIPRRHSGTGSRVSPSRPVPGSSGGLYPGPPVCAHLSPAAAAMPSTWGSAHRQAAGPVGGRLERRGMEGAIAERETMMAHEIEVHDDEEEGAEEEEE